MTASSRKKERFPYLLLLAVLVVILPIGVIKFTEHFKRESAATKVHDDVTLRLRGAGRQHAADSLEKVCVDKNCECSKAQVLESLNADLHEVALAILESRKCEDPLSGMRAEALARAGDFQGATTLAESVLEKNATEPFALYAMAHVAHFTEAPPVARERIQAAISAERGSAAHLLDFLHHYAQGALDAAESALSHILEIDAHDPEALYNLALIHHKRDDYQGAREGYLKVLSVVPEHANARYNLGILTHSVGALDEAKHNLAKLIAIVGAEEERVKGLQAIIDGPPASPANRFVFERAANPQ